jgi:hypothetical protein
MKESEANIPIVLMGLLLIMALGSMSLRMWRWQIGMMILHMGILVGWLRL